MQPSWQTKLFFWLIVGLLSTFFAEVPAGSDFFPFFQPNGLLIIVPIYTLHSVVLTWIVFHWNRRPVFSSLYIAGMIFGMYEAYITKVLWNPPWGDAFFTVGGIALVETAVLVLFWHPLLAFIVPLFIAETGLTQSRSVLYALSPHIQNLLQAKKKAIVFSLLLAACFGLYQSTNAPTPLHSLISCPANAAFLLLASFLWKRYTSGDQYSLQALLPGKLSFSILLLMLIFMYILFGRTMRYEALPSLPGQFSILGLYLLFFIMLLNCLKRSTLPAQADSESAIVALFSSWRFIFSLSLLFAFASFVGRACLDNLRAYILLSGWFFFVIFGLFLFAGTVKACLIPRRDNNNTSQKN